MCEEATRSRVLVVGATGRLGGCLVRASLAAGHPTFALVRPHHLAVPDSAPLTSLAGATVVKGSLEDYPSLLEAVRQVDVVICAVPTKQALEQKLLIRAIKDAGCVKPGLDAPPRDEVKIFGDGNTRGVFVEETDVAKFTICTIDDPRTLNNTLYLRPSGNVYSMNKLVDLWEKKINKFLNKIYITEEQLLKNIEDAPLPLKMDLIFIYSTFIKGDQTYFEIDSRKEGTQLYPHVNYTTVDGYLDKLV
ncbi:probable pinoresinol-lariciresinol reductase 3 isoform X3 [Oryza sativa Japonica Group]|uniref:probable pinoresinol-lariciresinol reductase 3 isoform X3 n=1 Tax=Oryza sativa subsp. japonica TaxID=39947 RepID=UPI000E1C2ECE|nr:isoflavone reductase homolog IRL1 isoform X3 [Oryza sativa Japonica Group]